MVLGFVGWVVIMRLIIKDVIVSAMMVSRG